MQITKVCQCCGAVKTIDLTPDQVQRYSQGKSAKEVFSNLTPSEQYLLNMGICGRCYDFIFNHGIIETRHIN